MPIHQQSSVVIGDAELVSATGQELRAAGTAVRHLEATTADATLPEALAGATSVVIVTRQDALALRLVLLVRDHDPLMRLVVTVFDRTLAEQLREELRCVVVSSAELVAAVIVASCISDDAQAVRRAAGGMEELRVKDGRLDRRVVPLVASTMVARGRQVVSGVVHPYDTSARILLGGIAGLLLMLTIEILIGMLSLHEDFVDALLIGTRTLATVSAPDDVLHASPAVKVLASATTIGGLGSTALFAAGLVGRLVEPRHLGIVGPSALPRSEHVIVVGMGQIGLRIALLLRDAGVAVVGVDRDASAIGVRLGERLQLPVVIATGEDRALLQRLGCHRARGLAAVTSDDLTNIAVAVAGRAVRPDLGVVLRAGDGEIARETRSLLHLGVVRDAHMVVAIGAAAAALGFEPETVVAHDGGAWIVEADGSDRQWPPPAQAGPLQGAST